MKKILFLILAVLCVASLFSCTTTIEGDIENNAPTENEVEQLPEDPVVDADSKFIEYLARVTNSAPAGSLSYLLETTHTLNGVTTSRACAVLDGKILNISTNGDTRSAEIYTPETLTAIDCGTKTYTQIPMEAALYEQTTASLECVSKYAGVEFVPSGYTVVDKDCYAEVAVIDGVTKIFIFDDEYNLKYIVYAVEDGSLVTEEIISFSSDPELIKPENFAVPSDFILI